MVNNKDLRVIKTRKTLFDSLIILMKDKSFEEIKVSDICEIALINRSTFYSHYQDKYELVMDFIKYLEESILKELEKNNKIFNTKEYYMETIKLIIDYIDERKDIYHSILINNRNSILLDIITNSIEKDINSRIDEGIILNKNLPSDIVSKFYIGAVSNIIIEWLQNKIKYSKEDIIKYLDVLIKEEI